MQRWKNPDEIDLEELLRSREGPVLRRRRHVEPPRAYVAAKLAYLPTTFTLGDDKDYMGFRNKPLTNHQEYLCFVVAILRNEGTDGTANYVSCTLLLYLNQGRWLDYTLDQRFLKHGL
ncbi:hypothetical protein XENOCAPTIV_011340 [Xenoophorus captivus]|uniref:Uncharacterized protein n=1 Tax=Xenoophorus captivus TaxID=1517983 RepID=A0ABV0Q3Q5_9TELE